MGRGTGPTASGPRAAVLGAVARVQEGAGPDLSGQPGVVTVRPLVTTPVPVGSTPFDGWPSTVMLTR